MLYAHAGRVDEGVAVGRKAVDENPKSGVAWANLSFALTTGGRHDEAIDAAQQAVRYAPPWTFALAIAYARAGRLDEARAALAKIQSRPPTAYNMWARAMVHLYLGEADAFFAAIESTPHHAFAPWVRMEPPIVRFKNDPRYAAMFARFKLPPPSS